MTCKFRAEQYGTTWYHSHLCLQAAEVLTGGIIINGPSTANYDEDLGTMLLMDWSHTSAFNAWKSSRIYGLEIATQNGLINGSNTFNCDETTDAACIRGGKRCETSFVGGKKYRIRLVGSQADGYIKFTIDQRELALGFTYEVLNGFKLHWTVNTKNLEIDWAQPTLQIIDDGGSVFPTDSNIVDVAVQNQWVYFVIQDLVNCGAYHPIHLHGHDFYVLAQGYVVFVPYLTPLNLENPPRRDTATLNGYGYLVIAFYTDNPGTWLMHCHIAWHASQGCALQFVEREIDIAATISEPALLNETCTAWEEYVPKQRFEQDDSEI